MIRAACGLDCGTCPAHVAMITDDDALRARTAEEWNAQFGAHFVPDEINCVGCREEGVHSGYCGQCPVRACAVRTGVPHCGSCVAFDSCATRKEFEAASGLSMEALFRS